MEEAIVRTASRIYFLLCFTFFNGKINNKDKGGSNLRRNKKARKARINRNITPKQAWEKYVGTSEKMFLSNFISEGLMDVEEMCKFYSRELPMVSDFDGILFSQKQIEQIQSLITSHLQRYVEQHGGLNNITLYTDEELNAIGVEDHEVIMDYLCHRFNMEREGLSEFLSEDLKKNFPDLPLPKSKK